MKRKTPRSYGILILAASFAGLVSACYFPRFVPGVADLYLDITGDVLRFHPPTAETIATATITATLRPCVAVRGAQVRWEWDTSDRSVIDFFDSITIEYKESSTVTVVAWNTGEAYVTVRVTAYGDGESFEDSRTIAVLFITP